MSTSQREMGAVLRTSGEHKVGNGSSWASGVGLGLLQVLERWGGTQGPGRVDV